MNRILMLCLVGALFCMPFFASAKSLDSQQKNDDILIKDDSTDRSSFKMTYRTSNKGEKISLLGYGAARWPMMPDSTPENPIIDQEKVNELVDYALKNGINYFTHHLPILGELQNRP